MTLHELMRDAFDARGGQIASGELVTRDGVKGRHLSTSLFARWTPEG